MDHIGIDVHKNESQLCILGEQGERKEQRIRTTPERFAAVLGERPRARILLEASTESEWVARCLERLGHEVIVADPNFAPMYATRTRTIKTDRRDARALAEACRLGAYRPAHRLSDAQRHVRGRLTVRDALVRTRTGYISVIRALLRQHGWRVPTGSAEGFIRRVLTLSLPGRLLSELAPLLAVMRQVNQQLAYSDERIAAVARADERVQRLQTVPSVGPVTAAAFVATLDDAGRFARAHQVEAYLGLVPREWSSGEGQRRGRITKAGHGNSRRQCATFSLRFSDKMRHLLSLLGRFSMDGGEGRRGASWSWEPDSRLVGAEAEGRRGPRIDSEQGGGYHPIPPPGPIRCSREPRPGEACRVTGSCRP
jgi:transposase